MKKLYYCSIGDLTGDNPDKVVKVKCNINNVKNIIKKLYPKYGLFHVMEQKEYNIWKKDTYETLDAKSDLEFLSKNFE